MRVKNLYTFIILLSIIAIAGVYLIEYIMHVPACPLCIYQRFPYLLLIFICAIAINGKNYKTYNFCLIIVILISIVLAAYHTGVERGIFELSSFCKPLISITQDMSVNEFQEMLDEKEDAMCNKPALVVLGLSLTEWNLLFSIFLLAFCLVYMNHKNKKKI